MPNIFEAAAAKQKARRGRIKRQGANTWMDQGTCLASLVALGQIFHVFDGKNNNTTAVGYCSGKHGNGVLYVAVKGPPKPDPAVVSAQADGMGIPHSDVVIIGNTSGLHSETAIIAAATGGDRSLLLDEFFYLEIACIGKGVCPDCSGFMAKYSIPHTQARSNPASDWVHPFTGAHFHGTNDNLQYRKGGYSVSLALQGGAYSKGWSRG